MNRLMKKQKKDQARAAKAKQKVLNRRAEIRKKAKMEKMAQRIEEDSRPKLVPYRKSQDEAYQAKVAQQNLEHNIQILQALEQEYLEEQQMKANLNQELEEEGYETLEEKMNALHKQAVETAEKAGLEIGAPNAPLKDVKEFVEQNEETLKRRKKKKKLSGSAEYRFTPNVPQGDA